MPDLKRKKNKGSADLWAVYHDKRPHTHTHTHLMAYAGSVDVEFTHADTDTN